jgi:hypothetical protein
MQWGAAPAVTAAAEGVLSEFQQNLVVAVVGVVLGILGTVAIERMKFRREPTTRLSWDAEVSNAMVSTDDTMRRRLRLSFDDFPIEGLSSVEFRVENSGNRVVKNERLRFSFPQDARILEAVPTSQPEREMGVVRRPDLEQDMSEAVFTIGHLERGRSVTLRLSVAARDITGWKVVDHNEEGDVDFHERAAARRKEDREHVPTFFALAFLTFTVPPLAALLGYVGQLAAVVLGVAFLVSIAPHIAPTGRTLRDFLTRPETAQGGIHIGTVDSSTFAIGDRSSATSERPGRVPPQPS